MTAPVQFDHYAEDYDGALNSGLSVTGECKDYFAEKRIQWLTHCLGRIAFSPTDVLDYGCGTGSAVPFIQRLLHPKVLIGVDTSQKSLEIARKLYAGRASFLLNSDYRRQEYVDLVYCNGVFHHIQPSGRAAEMKCIYQCLRPGGIFAFWENNPWNPGTRYVMSRIPFDRDAITLTPVEAGILVREAGFEVLRTDFLFIFPNWLKQLRPIERFVSRLPLGGQYQFLCRKSGGAP